MYAQHLDAHAAVRLAVPAGDAFAAGKVGVDDHRLADCEVDAITGFDDRARDLVAHDPRIGEERVLAFEDMVVGAADADMADCDPRPAGCRRAGLRPIFKDKVAG